MTDVPHIIGKSTEPAPFPERPTPPPVGAPQSLHDEYTRLMQKYERVCAAWQAIWGHRN
jgi:hypothetical protein